MDNIEQEMALFSIPADLVYRGFQMNPSTDDLIFGDELKVGMVVLFEDELLRTDPSREQGPNSDGYWTAHILEQSRWCKVEKIRAHSQNDEIVQFVALYADGTKRKRTYNKSYAWYVKKDSIPERTVRVSDPTSLTGSSPEVQLIFTWDDFEELVAGQGWIHVSDSTYQDEDVVYINGYGAVGGVARYVG